MKKAVTVFIAILCFASACGAQETGMLAGIARAKEVLKNQTAGYQICDGRVCRANVLLAVRGPDGKIQTVRIDYAGHVQSNLKIAFDNLALGMGTAFSVKEKGYLVLAMKRAVRDRYGRIEEAVYVPYSQQMDTPEVRKQGMVYLRAVVARARANLKRMGIKSRAYRGRLVADTVPTDVPITIALIEHIDPCDFNACCKAKRPVTPLADKVLVTLALNRGDSYRFCNSSAGARGLFQFTRPTYDLVRRKYPKAGLLPDFVSGAGNLVNAAMASFLIFDSNLGHLNRARLICFRRQPELKRLFIAASYNEGPGRAAHNRFLDQTKNYLKKFIAVWDNFFHSAKRGKETRRRASGRHFALLDH
ncbi:MAG: hypothetical protein M0018_04990 [Nitrospiraceae bacterium]|nr:hypothetical protein [Nitrospiraceae bacterium]